MLKNSLCIARARFRNESSKRRNWRATSHAGAILNWKNCVHSFNFFEITNNVKQSPQSVSLSSNNT